MQSFKVVNLEDPRRCPHCQSNKWKWIKTLPLHPENIGKSLLMLYECEKCKNQFIAAEKAQAKLVKTKPEKCIMCNSRNVIKISKSDADLELYFCKQCRCYMGVE